MKKKLIVVIVSIFIILICVIIIFLLNYKSYIFDERIEKQVVIAEFNNNFNNFDLVANYLQNTNEDVFIEKIDGKKVIIKISKNNKIEILELADEKIMKALYIIMNKLNYKYIREDGINGVYFVKQTSLRFADGIAYSKDNNKPDWGTIEVLENISERWFYYKGY